MKTNDLRYIRTKKAIKDAIYQLFLQHTFEEITVKKICEKANISRSAFYLHYEDKYDLMKQLQIEFIQKGKEIFDKTITKGKRAMMLQMLYYFKEEGDLFGLALTKNQSPELTAIIKKSIEQNAIDNILPHLTIKITNQTQEKYFLSFVSSALLGVLAEWTLSGKKESPEEIVAIVEQIISYEYIQ